jgi:hypothetical protein
VRLVWGIKKRQRDLGIRYTNGDGVEKIEDSVIEMQRTNACGGGWFIANREPGMLGLSKKKAE